MNTPRMFGAGPHACLATLAALAITTAANANEIEPPRGSLKSDSDYVRTGQQALLNWSIEFPGNITDVVTLDPTGPITPKEDLTLRLRVLGLGSKTNNGHGNNVDGVDSSNTGNKTAADTDATVDDEIRSDYVELYWASECITWTRSFAGDLNEADPTTLLEEISVTGGEALQFAVRSFTDSWQPLYQLGSSNIVVLKNGDPLPNVKGLQVGQIEEFLKPYITSHGTVRIGDHDLLIMCELNESDPTKTAYNLQDFVFMLTFE